MHTQQGQGGAACKDSTITQQLTFCEAQDNSLVASPMQKAAEDKQWTQARVWEFDNFAEADVRWLWRRDCNGQEYTQSGRFTCAMRRGAAWTNQGGLQRERRLVRRW